MGTVAEYHNEFEMLIKGVTIPESLLKSFYISGLKLDLQCLLLRSNPSTLGEDFFKARITEAHFGSIAEKDQNIPEKEDTTLSLPRPDDEECTSGKTIADEFVGIEQNEPVDFNEGKSLNLVVAANDVGNMGFSAMDHQWQGDFIATSGAAEVDTWNHNKSQPVSTFEWGSGSVRCNLREPNILAIYGYHKLWSKT
ncbi:hypothetical protein Tco_0591497 [Tanacetum coccineum]